MRLDRSAQALGAFSPARGTFGVAPPVAERGHRTKSREGVAFAPPRTAMGPCASVPSAWKIESFAVFPSLIDQTGAGGAIVTNPSGSIACSFSIQEIAASIEGHNCSIVFEIAGTFRIGARQHDEERRGVDGAVILTERAPLSELSSRPCGLRA